MRMLNTDLLKLPMPMLAAKYPGKVLDVSVSTDQLRYLEANPRDRPSGIDVDASGNVKGTLNLILKLSVLVGE